MANANPGLARAVAEVTQPFGSPVSGDVLRSLQKYLQDKKSVDNVYKALVLRAWAEPLSQAVFDKVVSIFKQCLLRHTPSLDVLELLDEFCTALPRALPLPPSSMKAVQYAQACVCRAYDNCVAQAAASQQRPLTAEKKLPTMHERPASASRLPPRGRTPSLSNPPTKPPTPSLLANVGGGGAGGGGVVGVVGKQQQGGTGSQVLELHSRPSTAQTARAAGLPGYGGGSGQLLRRASSSLDSEAEAKLLTTPSWAVQGAATFVDLLDEGQQPVQVDGPVESTWLGYVPELNPSLTPAPYGEEPSLMLLDEESEHEGQGTTAPPVSATCLARSILDVDEERVEEHLLEVALALKQEVQLDSETKAGTAPRPPSGRHHGKAAQPPPPPLVNSAHARMMFSHQPYSVQEELSMSQADVAVVVEVVCGQGAAKAFGAEAPCAGSAGAKPWSESYEEGDLGQVCGSILMKLIMDLFLNAGPGTSYPLVLRMLRQSLASPQPEIRARAFDVIFNLTLHSALLEPSDHAAAHSDGGEEQHSGEQQQDHHHDQPQQPQQQQGQAEEDGLPPVQDQSTKHGQMMCWLRALCMQLLADVTEADESSEEVWQAGLACFLVLITYKGHIVERWAIHTPLNAVSGLLCACVMFGWSPDLHAQLIRLASTLLVKHVPDAAVLAGAAAAADRAVVEEWAKGGRHSRQQQQQQPQQPKLKPRLGGVPEEFGGLQEVLRHMALAPTPAARADMLGVILHYLSPDESVMGALTRAILTRGLTPFTAALQTAVACPRPGSLALRLASCLAGHVPYGPHGHGFPAGHARNHSQGRGLYFGGGPGFGFGHNGSSLVGAGSAPNPATGSVVNNWLSLEAMRFNAGGVSHTGSLRGGHFGGPSTISPHALPLPIAELLLAFLSSLEEAVVLPLQLCLKQPDVSTHITVTLDHIASAGNSMQEGGHPHPNATAAAWEALKAACEEVVAPPSFSGGEGASNGGREGTEHSTYNSITGGSAEGGVGVSGHAPRRRRACASMARLPASGGQLALHWLHQVLLQAFLVCQSHPLLMSPSTLRSPTSARQATAGTFGSNSPSGGGHQQQPHSPQASVHDPGAGARAAAAAAIAVRATSPGSVFGSPSPPPAANGGTGTIRSTSHQGGVRGGGGNTTTMHAGGASPRNGMARGGSGELQSRHSGGAPHEQQQQLASAWTCKLAGVLTHVVKEVPSGGRLLVAAMARVVSDLKQGVSNLQARMQIVMAVHHVTLLWLLQSGSHGASDRQAAIQELSDQVLHSLTQPLHPCDDASHSRSSRSGTGGPGSHVAGSVPTSAAQQRQSFDDLPGPGGATLKLIRSHNLRVSCSFEADTASTTGDTVSTLQLNPPFGHCHIAFAILTSQAGFVPDVLQATPPELLVGLLQHCVHPHLGGKGQARGFMGRTNPACAYASGTAQEFMVDGLQVHTLSQPPPTWGDVAMDRRLALLLALMACCGLDPDAFVKFGLSHVIRSGLMSSTDPRERYYAGVYLLRHLQLNQQDKYWRALRALLLQAQQLNDERMIDNPYLTAASMLSIDGY